MLRGYSGGTWGVLRGYIGGILNNSMQDKAQGGAFAVPSTGLLKPTFRTWTACVWACHPRNSPPPNLSNKSKFSPRPTYPADHMGEKAIRSKFGAGLEGGLIKPVAQTAWAWQLLPFPAQLQRL